MAVGKSRPEAEKSLVEKTAERSEQIAERVNAATEFQSDAEANIRSLAEKAYPDKSEEQNRYARKIRASLEKYIREDKTLEDLWDYLGGKECRITAIVQGILHFYAGKKVGEKEIGLQDFLKPAISAESNLDKTYLGERKATIEKTRSELTALLEEIQAGNPNE